MSGRLAIHGGEPVRRSLLPYGRQTIDDADVAAVVAALRSDWLTTGPQVDAFERDVAAVSGVPHAVAVSNGTAALHTALAGLGIGPGDEVIVPPMTFAATANACLYVGATPVFADVEPDTLLIDPNEVRSKLTPRTRAIIGVDYAGQPCDWDALREIARPGGRIHLVADACHAIGGAYKSRPVGSLADVTVYSFHPVKHVATGEGGMCVTADEAVARRMKVFRSHGITTDHRQRAERGSYHYDMVELGYNYRLTDIQCALGRSQLAKLDASVQARRAIASRYDAAFASGPARPLAVRAWAHHAYHLYVVRLDRDRCALDRDATFQALRAEGIGANVHYIPVHLHPFYRRTLGTKEGVCPRAEEAFRDILTLPLFPSMTDADASDVITAVQKVVSGGA